jgi:hypothetical protein
VPLEAIRAMIARRGRFNLNIADKKYRFVSGPLATRGSTPNHARRGRTNRFHVVFPLLIST